MQDPGPALAAFLQDEWDKLGTTRGAWCREAKIPDTTVIRWLQGAEPDMRNLRMVVDALPGRTLLDLLIVMGTLTEREAKGRTVAPRPTPDIDAAIKLDPNLEPLERKALLAFRKAWRDVASGASRGRRVRS